METQRALLLLLSICLLELTNVIDAKFCAFELNGERRFYTCPRNEYCCNFGCCVSPAFQFYQLWYYWLLVIFMFLLCSGGGWWYRYWLQNRYRTCPGSVLPVTSSGSRHCTLPTRAASSQPRRPSRPRVARVSYNPSRDAVLLHRVWKGPRNCPPPSYSSTQGELPNGVSPCPPVSSPSHVAHSSAGITGQECPYYQLYGPPPSYESVMSGVVENSLSVVSTAVQSNHVHTAASPNLPETSYAASATDNNVITSLHSPTRRAYSSEQDDSSLLEGTSDKSSINAHAEPSSNVQTQHSDPCEQTRKREGDNSSST